MSEPEPTYGAGEDIPGTPRPFPFGLVSIGFGLIALTSAIVTFGTGSAAWFPLSVGGFSALYWFMLAGCFVSAAVAFHRGQWWGGAPGAAIGAVASLPAFFAVAAMLFTSMF